MMNANGTTPRANEREYERGLVWVNCPYEEVSSLVIEALKCKVPIHSGEEPPKEEAPSCVILCPNQESIPSKIRRIQAQTSNAPVLVFASSPDPRLAEEALRAGASGFIHAGMRPERIPLALSLASGGEVLIPRQLLGELLGKRLFLRRPMLLDP
jgi:DNA-binding NarL/FixJ family response regulator